MADLQGGKFGNGFLSSGIAIAAAPGLNSIRSSTMRASLSAIIGGTVSKLTGGKFVNGATTAAFIATFSAMARGVVGQRSGSGGGGAATIEVGQSRPMTDGEITMAQDIFGEDVDYSKVLVFNKNFAFFQRRGTAMSPDGNIYFHPVDYMDDFSSAGISGRSWFIHELTHVWQYQQGVNVYGAALDRRYDYRPLMPGKSFQTYGLEQQGDIVQDYYLIRSGYHPQWPGHGVRDYEAVLPFGK